MGTISIMIVDADAGNLAKLTAALKLHQDLEVVSSVSRRDAAIKQLSQELDLMLLHPGVLKQGGLTRFVRTIQTQAPRTRIILLLQDMPADDILIEAIRNGVRGYVRRDDPPALISKALRTVHGGAIWAERRILEQTIAKHMLLPQVLHDHVPDLEPLTSREMDMLNLVLKGATNREIAEMSNISERTVKTHLYRVYRKLKVKSRTKAIALLSH